MAEMEGFDLHFACGKIIVLHQLDGGKQQSTGLLHSDRFKSICIPYEQ